MQQLLNVQPVWNIVDYSFSVISKNKWKWHFKVCLKLEMWRMHRNQDVHKALMRAKWVMTFAHHFLASLQLSIYCIKCMAWPLRMAWKFRGSSMCPQFPLLRLSLRLCVHTKRTWYFLSKYVIKENKLHWTGPRAENLRLCSQRNDKHQDRMTCFLFFEINTL